MQTSRQSGSIASFVVIGLVLVGILLAGLYFSKERARQVVGGTNEVAQQNQPKKEEEKKPEENKPATTTQPSTTKPSTSQGTTPSTTTPSTQSQTPSSQSAPRTQTTPTTAPSTGPVHIATTGPEDSLVVKAIVLLAISLTIGTYVTSRRDYIRTALRS